jgi:hypothetical protein
MRNLCHEIWGINDWVDITIGRSERVPGPVMIHQLKIREFMIKMNIRVYSSNDHWRKYIHLMTIGKPCKMIVISLLKKKE